MISWLSVIVLAYLFFALSAFGDKVILSGTPKPKTYTFYVGALNALAVLLIPFTGLRLPSVSMFFWIILDALIFISGVYFGFLAVKKFDVSKVTVTIGAAQPIFIFFISWFFWGYQALSIYNFFAFVLLFIGSLIISFEKKPEITADFLLLTFFTSLLFSLDYVLLKFIFANFSYVQGFIWTRIFIFAFAVLLLLSKKNRADFFKKRDTENKKLKKTFVATQACGGVANILQSFAISLAPVAFLPIVNSLRGVQYVFLFVITIFVSYFFPKILKENLSIKIVAQKIIAIILIVFGLAILAI